MKNDEGEVVDLYIPRKWWVGTGLARLGAAGLMGSLGRL
jgi:hypothetical protein